MASGAYPAVRADRPEAFLKLLGAGEIALGGALLLPDRPGRPGRAGPDGLLRRPARRLLAHPGHARGRQHPRPPAQGIAIAKDSWMFGAGAPWSSTPFCRVRTTCARPPPTASRGRGRRRRRRRPGRGARTWFSRAKTATAETTHHAVEAAKTAKDEHGPQVAAALSTAGAAVADKAGQLREAAAETAKTSTARKSTAALTSVARVAAPTRPSSSRVRRRQGRRLPPAGRPRRSAAAGDAGRQGRAAARGRHRQGRCRFATTAADGARAAP